MISERRLKKWRREALKHYEIPAGTKDGVNAFDAMRAQIRALDERILQLTQELLDQHLMKGGSKQ